MEAQPISIKKEKKKQKAWFKSSKKNKEKVTSKSKDKKDKKGKSKTKKNLNLNEDNNVSSSEFCSTSTSIICSTEGVAKIHESQETEESKDNEVYHFSNRKKLKDDDDDDTMQENQYSVESEKDINKGHKTIEKRIQQYYEPEDISKVKEAIRAIEAGELDKGIPSGKSNSLQKREGENISKVQKLSKQFDSNQSSNVNKNTIKKVVGSHIEQNQTSIKTKKNIINVTNSNNEKEYIIPLKVLKLEDYGNIKLTKSTTYSQLREAIISKCNINSFIFQDVSTKRPLLNEAKKKVLQSTNNVIIAEKGADILLAESILHGSKIFAVGANGTFSFKVFWWDSHYHNNHQVWLKFEPGRITVSGVGGSFKLFDYKTLKVPLVFATVKGSERTFQFLRNKGSSLASRFYSINKEQRQAIAIYFCFVWRPQAVRRGWMPRLNSDISPETAGDVDDPVRFNNILKKHITEINAIIKEIERRNDPKLVRKYLHLFQAMFGGGYTSVSDNDFEELTGDGVSLRKRIKDWRKLTNDKDDVIVEKKYSHEPTHSRTEKARNNEDENDDLILVEFGNDEDLVFTTSNVSQNEVAAVPDITIVDGAPPPPPPPVAANINKKPAILPVNYDAIVQKDIKGTIWADIDSFNLSKLTIEKLEKELTIIFGRDARDSGLDKKEEKAETVLDSNRLRNLEILLKMDELKGLSMDEIISGVINLDPRIYQLSVLERLVRKVGNGENSLHAFLPSDKEIKTLMEHQSKEGDKIPLTEGEKFFLELSKQVKHRVERLEYSFFMLKWQDEYDLIKTQLKQINDAIESVRNNDKLKKVLKVILEILTVLNPKNGNIKGFKISTFIPKVERVHGAVSNPLPKKPEKEIIEEDDKNMTQEERKRAKLEKLRKKKKREEDAEGWKVLLLEYLTIYITKFKECRYFWKDLIEPCEVACGIDILLLDKQCTSWSSQIASMKDFLENNELSSNDPLILKLKEFLQSEDKINALIEEVSKARTETENLWHYFGEEVSSEPQFIFKYIAEFSKVIERYFNLVKSSKEIKIKILKGQLPLNPFKPKPKKKKVMAKKEQNTNKKSKLDEIRARLESRNNGNEEDEVGGEVTDIENANETNNNETNNNEINNDV